MFRIPFYFCCCSFHFWSEALAGEKPGRVKAEDKFFFASPAHRVAVCMLFCFEKYPSCLEVCDDCFFNVSNVFSCEPVVSCPVFFSDAFEGNNLGSDAVLYG